MPSRWRETPRRGPEEGSASPGGLIAVRQRFGQGLIWQWTVQLDLLDLTQTRAYSVTREGLSHLIQRISTTGTVQDDRFHVLAVTDMP
jgi:hypothetical protein